MVELHSVELYNCTHPELKKHMHPKNSSPLSPMEKSAAEAEQYNSKKVHLLSSHSSKYLQVEETKR